MTRYETTHARTCLSVHNCLTISHGGVAKFNGMRHSLPILMMVHNANC